MVEKLGPDFLVKIQNWAYFSMNNLNVIKFVFIVCPSQILAKYVKTKIKIIKLWPFAFTFSVIVHRHFYVID